MLREASAYKSTITGEIPLDLLVMERKYVHKQAGKEELACPRKKLRSE